MVFMVFSVPWNNTFFYNTESTVTADPFTFQREVFRISFIVIVHLKVWTLLSVRVIITLFEDTIVGI